MGLPPYLTPAISPNGQSSNPALVRMGSVLVPAISHIVSPAD